MFLMNIVLKQGERSLSNIIYIITHFREKFQAIKLFKLLSFVLAGYALVSILFILFVWIDHAAFPLNLEAMELTRLEHLKRVMNGLPLYPAPSADFVPLAYNPLSYFLAVPFANIFGTNLFSMRLVSILGMFGMGAIIFLAVRKATNSNWWGLMAIGLFAASYRVTDTYLDNAHADSWLMFSILLGCYFIDKNCSRFHNLFGLILMVMAFWIKQPGAIFVAGAVAYLFWRDGWRKTWFSLFIAMIFGPIFYWAAPPWLFGSHFHYFTWDMPRHWIPSQPDRLFALLLDGFKYFVKYYGILGITGIFTAGLALAKKPKKVNIWSFMLPIAILSAIQAAITPDSNRNVFIPLAVWFIITGVIGIQKLTQNYLQIQRWRLDLLAIVLSFAVLVYNPMSVLVSPQANLAYQDLINYLKSVDGSVYAPWIGQLQDGYKFYPAAHWVPIQDMARSKIDPIQYNIPSTQNLLKSVVHPTGRAYILSTYPFEEEHFLGFLKDKYVLDTDLGDRFKALGTLPKRYNLKWPRYLYRYQPQFHP